MLADVWILHWLVSSPLKHQLLYHICAGQFLWKTSTYLTAHECVLSSFGGTISWFRASNDGYLETLDIMLVFFWTLRRNSKLKLSDNWSRSQNIFVQPWFFWFLLKPWTASVGWWLSSQTLHKHMTQQFQHLPVLTFQGLYLYGLVTCWILPSPYRQRHQWKPQMWIKKTEDNDEYL